MSNVIRIVILVLGTVAALFFNVWYLIFPLAILIGYLYEGRAIRVALISFLSIGLTWSILLFIKDQSFANAPSEVFGRVAGLSSVAVIAFSGLIGGVVGLIGALAGKLLSK